MQKRLLILLGILLGLAIIGIFALPIALKAIPPRYAARYLPEPLQAMAAPEQSSPILPTVAQPADISLLLNSEEGALATAESSIPPTFTPASIQTTEEIAETAVAEPTTEVIPPTFTPAPTATPTPTMIPFPANARIERVRHEFQEWNNCGPATLAMTLSVFGMDLRQGDTAVVLKPNPEDRNVTPFEMASYVNKETNLKAINRVNGNADLIKRFIANNIPVILEIGIEPPGELRWMGWYGHYMLVVAYNDEKQEFNVYDSWLGTGNEPLTNSDPNGRILTYEELATNWPHFNRNYIAVYQPEQAELVANIIGENMNEQLMWQNAREIAQQEASQDPENPFFWFNLGTSNNALGEHELAAAAFDQARTIGLPWRMLWYQFGPYEAYYQVGRYEDVILLADVTLNDRPYFEESFYYKGLAQAALGDVAASRNNLQRAADFNPNFEAPFIALQQLDSAN